MYNWKVNQQKNIFRFSYSLEHANLWQRNNCPSFRLQQPRCHSSECTLLQVWQMSRGFCPGRKGQRVGVALHPAARNSH